MSDASFASTCASATASRRATRGPSSSVPWSSVTAGFGRVAALTPERFPEADLTAAVYDPPAPGMPHIAVLFDADGLVVARPVESIDAGEAELAKLFRQIATKLRTEHAARVAGRKRA